MFDIIGAEMKKDPTLTAGADIPSEILVFSPEDDGVEGIPAISHSLYRTNWKALPLHTHRDAIEICFCSRGSLVFECNGESHTLRPNNVFLTQPDDSHHLTANLKGMRMYWLFFRYPKKSRTVLGLAREETRELVTRLRAIDAHVFSVDPSMRQLFRDIFTVYRDQKRGPFRRLVLRTLILKILLMVIESSENRPRNREIKIVTHIAHILEKRPSHRFTVEELAAHAKLSTSYFTALFRQVTGLPPYAYLADCRIKEAKRRLVETSETIAAISKALGYNSPQHFTNQFRKAFGTTPRTFRTGII